jgi:hypothetical protein
MSYATVIAQIETILKSATGVISATVYTYQVLVRDQATYISKFKDTTNNVIHGYIITRNSFSETSEGAGKTMTRTSKWVIRGYYSIGSAGATEITFQGIVDNIATKFGENPRLNNTVLLTDNFSLDNFDSGMWGDVLCHYAEMSLTTQEQIDY